MNSRNFAGILLLGLVFLVTACGGGGGGGNNAPVVTAEIGPQGGTLTASDGTQVIIPAGAVDTATTISVKISSEGAPALPDGVIPGTIYEFTPHDVVFNQPVTIRIPVPDGATGDQVFFASPGGEWANYSATVSNGFAELQRGRFSWAIIAACGPNTNNDPYHCVYPKGNTEVTATPSDALTSNGGFIYINAESTVHFTMHYSAARDCQSPILKLSTTENVEIFNQAVVLTPVADDPQRSAGSTTVDIPYSYDQNNRPIWYQANFSCKRSIWRSSFGGSDYFWIRPSILPPGTYSVSVNVSGLYDTGLVLQNNAGDNLPISYNGTFSFNTPLDVGASYAVSILSQPLGYTCTLQNASGTSQTNVTNIAVSCVTNSYTIGGNVNGLLGTGLVLQNNGGNNLSVSANGTFTFMNTVASNQTFNVSVLNQPLYQICDVQNASGTALANVTNVAVNCVTQYYSIGGSVSGLSGSGLVLQYHGANNLAISSNGSFIFPVFVIRDTAYSVNIYSQPTGQVCTLQNASGTAQANITNVAVNCTTNNYSIGGNVSGLTNTGLILQNNSGNDLAIKADGPFTFTNTVAGNTSYSVSVSSQPFEQYCTVQNETGTAVADVSNVTVNCVANQYSGPVLLGTPGSVTTSNAVDMPAMAMDANGNAFAVWYQYSSGTWNVWANRYVAGSGWGTPEAIETETGVVDTSTAPGIAVDANGNAMAVWAQQDSTFTTSVWANRYVAGSGWGTATLVEHNDNGLALHPYVAMDANGNAIAVWMQWNGVSTLPSYYGIWASRYVAMNDAWGTPELIDNQSYSNSGHAYDPRVAMDDAGNAVAIWREHDGQYWIMLANRYVAGAGWGTAEVIEDNASNAYEFDLAINHTDGSARAVWRQDYSPTEIWTNTMSSTGTWGIPDQVDSNSTSNSVAPRVAMNADSDAVIVWTGAGVAHAEIFSKRYINGVAGSEEIVSTTANMSDVYVSGILLDDSGNATAVWQQFDMTAESIFTSRYPTAGTAWNTPSLLENTDTLDIFLPVVCGNASGQAMAAWVFSDSTLWSNYFSP